MYYDNKICDGITEEDRPALVEGLPPVMVIDTVGRENQSEGGSNSNEQEVLVVMKLINLLLLEGVEEDDIGVISLYNYQVTKVIAELRKIQKNIKVSTVDAYQGGERKIIILTFVRCDPTSFLSNDKRMNVALSRAKNHMFIVCHKKGLSRGSMFKVIFEHASTIANGSKSMDEVLQSGKFKDLLEREMFEGMVEDILDDFDDLIPKTKRKGEDDLNPVVKKSLQEDICE